MELLQLRYFYESAKYENFSKTAEKYRVPATSVSASVKRLEEELGCRLFDRTSNSIVLNYNGKRLRQSLQTVFSELDEVVESLSCESADTREIKMLVRAMRSNITDHIIEYGTKHPHIAFKTVFDFGETDFENYDIIIDEETDAYPEYERFKLYSINLRMKVSKDSSILGRRLTLKQLERHPFISMGEQSNMHKILMKVCEGAGFAPDIVVQSNDIRCYDRLIESGMGIGLGREKPQTENVGYLDVADFNEKYTVYSYYKKQAAYGNVQHFLNFLKNRRDRL